MVITSRLTAYDAATEIITELDNDVNCVGFDSEGDIVSGVNDSNMRVVIVQAFSDLADIIGDCPEDHAVETLAYALLEIDEVEFA